MAGRFGPPALISIGLALLNLGAFFVMLGGAAGIQKNTIPITTLVNKLNAGPGSVLSIGDVKPVSTSSNIISFEWFKAVFQVLTILFALATLASGQVYRFRLALVGLFAACAVLYTDASNTFYYVWLQTHNQPETVVPSNIKKMITSYFAGCIASATLDYMLIISLGIGLGEGHAANTYSHAAAPHVKEHNGAANV